jgi:Tol biopolymer transport system component
MKLNEMKLKFSLGLLLLLIINSCQPKKSLIDYFGQIPPDKTPKIFAPKIICLDDRFEAKGTFSPDGKSFYFTITNSDFTSQKILYTEFINGQWSIPDTASFSKRYNNHEPFISYDGQKLYFSSDRDKDTLENKKDLFMTEKQESVWSEPTKLKTPFNSEFTELLYNQSKNGTIYFTSNRPGGIGKWDIYFAKCNNGVFDKLENVGSPINQVYAWDPCIAPDESYLIFSAGREDGYGASDIYVSFKENDTWTEPKNLGNLINTEANEYSPFLSPDNKYLFFVRHDGKKGDIYWVDLNIVKDYREKI